MAWEGPPGSIVYPEPGTSGTICPAGWDEDFDRSQMSTQVMIARSAPAEVPDFVYTLTATPPVPGPGGLSADPNQEAATVLHVNKTAMDDVDATIWLGYLNRHSRVTYTSAGDDTVDPAIPETSREYELTADVIEYAEHYDLPVAWSGGTSHVPTGLVTLRLSVGTEVPQLWFDPYGVDHYGRMTFNRTDLINTDRDLFTKLADRILEVRSSNSVPRIEAVTIDARTGDKLANMRLMSSAAPEKPSRYRMALTVGERTIYDRMMFATAVRHFIARDEWTLRITLDIAEWAAQL